MNTIRLNRRMDTNDYIISEVTGDTGVTITRSGKQVKLYVRDVMSQAEADALIGTASWTVTAALPAPVRA